jgi:hypothetical protein
MSGGGRFPAKNLRRVGDFPPKIPLRPPANETFLVGTLVCTYKASVYIQDLCVCVRETMCTYKTSVCVCVCLYMYIYIYIYIIYKTCICLMAGNYIYIYIYIYTHTHTHTHTYIHTYISDRIWKYLYTKPVFAFWREMMRPKRHRQMFLFFVFFFTKIKGKTQIFASEEASSDVPSVFYFYKNKKEKLFALYICIHTYIHVAYMYVCMYVCMCVCTNVYYVHTSCESAQDLLIYYYLLLIYY